MRKTRTMTGAFEFKAILETVWGANKGDEREHESLRSNVHYWKKKRERDRDRESRQGKSGSTSCNKG